MSSKINLQSLEDEGLEFVTRLSNSSLEALLKDLPGEIQHNGKRHVIAGGPWRKDRDRERRELRIAKAEAALTKLAAAKRTKPDAQKIASQAGRTLQQLKAYKYFTYRVDAGILQWERRQDTIVRCDTKD
jgi:hypothetical protein